ncbi:BnaA01g32440D [Brassica napus]|uniref:1,3-beta-glucan synthase n=1 Tax=Brassica napus TaxID=3708 RepID=A0A078HDK8_BRANA|nr:BnaA01g32440D [Brassica napus]
MSDTTLVKMSQVEALWERLVNAALRRDRTGEAGGGGGGCPGEGRDIDDILRAADELQANDPVIARILCEHAYSLEQKLDPNSESVSVLQFRTGLMSVIKQRDEKREVETINRSQDINRLQGFYQRYREKNNVDTLKEEEKQLCESGAFTDELEQKTVERKRVFANLKVLEHVLEQVSKEIFEELKHANDSDAAMSHEDTVAYNIVPFDAPVTANATTAFCEVQAAVTALKYFPGLPKLPAEFPLPATRNADMLDFLHYIFGFQRDSVSNQREHIILLLSNEQSRLNIPGETEHKLDDAAVSNVFLKSLDNYIKWCDYLCIQPSWRNLEAISGEKKLLYLSLYFLIWGEAANIRFLPECLCYIFHHMVREMDEILRQQVARPAESCRPVDSCGSEDDVSFLDHVISPLYEVVSAEAFNNGNGRVPHSAWRNYDDFNEYFWSLQSFELGWPWRTSSSFFQKPRPRAKFELKPGREKHRGKTSFVEHRTFLHLYHSFHRLWIFLAMTFQALAIVAFNEKSLASRKTLREILSLGPTYVVMKFSKSVLDVFMMYGAYSTTRRLAVYRMFLRLIWFGLASVFISFLYVRALQEDSKPNSDSVVFTLYVIVIAIYGGVQFFFGVLMRIPACHNIANKCDGWTVVRFFKWMWRQERHYVGRGMYEKTSDFIKYYLYTGDFKCWYLLFWLVVLSAKFSFAYFLQIEPLVSPTRMIVKHGNYNALTVASLWAPVASIYLLDIHIFYTLVSAFLGFFLGVRDRLGKGPYVALPFSQIRSLEEIHKQFKKFPGAFMRALHVPITNRSWDPSHEVVDKKNRVEAAHFAPFWNQIIKCLREEDYITDFEMDLLLMPKNYGSRLVQWPLFLLSSKILLATEIAAESKSQEEIVKRIEKDVYMKYAVEEVYYSLERVLITTLEAEGKIWVDRIFRDIRTSITMRTIHLDFTLKKLSLVITRVTALLGVLKENETPENAAAVTKALQDLYDVMRLDILAVDIRGHYDTWNLLTRASNEGRLFTKLNWPKDPEMKALVKRLYSLLTIKDSTAPHVPRNLEARRRLQFFTNSLFMDVPQPKPVHQMLSFSVFTPYCSEVVLYSMAELTKRNEDGISILFYLQKIYPDEWKNFLARIGKDENALEGDLHNERDILELRFWASYRGQTLARTVRGMMYYRKALMLQSYLERKAGTVTDEESTLYGNNPTDAEGFELSPEAKAQADLKFTYVVTCQMYGRQKEDRKPEAADIALLMQRNEALRVAYIDVVETLKEGKSHKEYYSKLVKADISGKDKEVYSRRLPGDPKLGQGKAEDQNHAIVFTRGNAVQTIDMNQDNYFEEALKMRNLLEEFDRDHGIRPPSILGVREHVFTGSVSSLASFMSNQETTIVTLGQRVLAKPLKIRMHYGHSDVFDRVFHITRGGISKASRVINASEDIFAGFNSTLRQGNITHHEYIQLGKGRAVGLNQIALFEGKVAGGNGEQVLSRDVYRLGQLLDFFRMMSFYFTTVGFYFCTMLTVLTLYIFLYGKAYLAFSGVGATIRERAILVNNTALSAALSAQFLFQIGVFTAVPMILGFILEQGFLQALVSFTTMQFQLCTVFFTFSIGTRAHYFGRTLLHGGASVCQQYQTTGRGFVVKHIKFSENYRLYSRSHFVKGMEVILLLVVYLAYGNDEAGSVSYILLIVSSCFLAFSWLFAPYLFNPSGFERQKVVEDFKEWTKWLFYRGGGIGVEGAESWEAWWEEELSHIGTLSGRMVETILSLRFFIFQYGIVYKLNVHGSDTSFAVYGWSWAAFAVILVIFKVFAFIQKIAVSFRLVRRFIQGLALLVSLAGIIVAVVLTELSVTDIFACVLAFLPTGWGVLSIACAWKPTIKRIGMWESVRSLARLYDAGMGMLIFLPVVLFSLFPFVFN